MVPRIGSAIALLALVSLACAAPPLPEQAPPQVSPLQVNPGARLGTDRVVILPDASGTMYARGTFPEAKALSRGFIAGMPNGSYDAGLISFGGTDRITVPVGPFDRGTLASTAADLRVLGDIDGRGGNTPYHRVFQEIQEQVTGAGGSGAVVVFSDGLPDRDAWALMAAAQLAEAHGGELCFHTVQTGNDPAGAALLQQLSQVTSCGSFRTSDAVRDPSGMMALERDVFRPSGGGATTGGRTTSGSGLPSDTCGDLVRLRGVEFDFDESVIRPDAQPVLDVAVDQLNACPKSRVRIDGHTDWIGTKEYNQGLSERRAEAVRRYLTGKGIQSNRLRTQGFGETDPIASNQTREGRARNRRVEIHPE